MGPARKEIKDSMNYEDHTEHCYDEDVDHGWRELNSDRARDPYEAVKTESEGMGEHNDCVVRAMSLALEVPYKETHAVLKKAGRRGRGRTYPETYNAAMEELCRRYGKKTTFLTPRKYTGRAKPSKYTPKTIGKKYPTGRYVCHVRGHAFALVDGKVLDWVDGRRHHITHVERIDTTS